MWSTFKFASLVYITQRPVRLIYYHLCTVNKVSKCWQLGHPLSQTFIKLYTAALERCHRGHYSKLRGLVAAVWRVWGENRLAACMHVCAHTNNIFTEIRECDRPKNRQDSESVDEMTLQLRLRCKWAVQLSVAALSCTKMKNEGHTKPPAQMTYRAIVLMRMGSYGDNFYFCRLYTTSESSCRLCIYCRRQTRFNHETDIMLTAWTL